MDVAPFFLLSLFAAFVLMVVGFVFYLFVSGALHSVHLRPFRFALYILLLITAMTGGVKLIQQSSEACETTALEADQELPQVALPTQC
ncbi:MAG: hypothetical protein ACREJN_10425 [Nitrospiraceae bacterium]